MLTTVQAATGVPKMIIRVPMRATTGVLVETEKAPPGRFVRCFYPEAGINEDPGLKGLKGWKVRGMLG